MPIYEYQGKHYDIETTDPAVAKSKILASLPPPETAAQSFGRGAASLADSALNAATGTLDVLARAPALAYYGGVKGMPLDQAYQQAASETTLPKDIIGRATGVTGTAGYEGAPLRRLGTAVGNTLNENVIQPVAEATGLPSGYVGDVATLGTMAIAPGVPKVAGAVGTGVKNAGQSVAQGARAVAGPAVDVAQGVYGGFTGTTKAPGRPVKAWETPSARQPIGETYIPADALEQWRTGQITAEQAQALARSTNELPQSALRRTEGMVPYQGQQWRALGEQIGSSYRDPVKLVAEAAGDVAFGGLPTAARLGLKGYNLYQGAKAFNELGKAGFTPITPAEQAALKAGGRYPGSPPRPPGYYGGGGNPPAGPSGPVAPQSTAQQAQQAAAARIQPQQQPPTTPPPVAGPIEPAPLPTPKLLTPEQQAAVQARWEQTPGYTPPRTTAPAPAATIPADKQAILDQIRARGQQPVAGPVAPGPIPDAPAAPVRERNMMAEMQARIKNNPGAGTGTASVDQLFEGMPQYSAKELKQMEAIQNNPERYGIRKGFGSGETVSDIELQAAQNQARRTGSIADQRIAEQLQKRVDEQRAAGITHVPKPKDANFMLTPEQQQSWNSLTRTPDTVRLLEELRKSKDPAAHSLADLLEKQGYNIKKGEK